MSKYPGFEEKANIMNIVEIYKNIDRLRDIIWNFNVYFNKEEDILQYLLNSSAELLKQLLCIDIQNAIFNFSKKELEYWASYFEKFQVAVEVRDDLALYDYFNTELRQLMCRLLQILWKEHMEEIRDYFWHENSEALKIRYPEILKKIESFKGCGNPTGIREYGMRGKVLYIKGKIGEYDLYSEYNPNDFSLRVVNKYDLRSYKKIMIWTLGGDFDVGALYLMYERCQIKFEVYVADIEIFGQFLHNVFRKGVLIEQKINYYFERTIDDFLVDASMEKNVYVYIGAYSLQSINEKNRIEKVFKDKQIDNNMKSGKEENFICK